MSNAFTRNLNPRNKTPQTKQARSDQVKNNAGGFVFTIAPKERLERFLMLGVDKGTYYANERNLFDQNHSFLINMIQKNPIEYLNIVHDVSVAGRAYRNSPALFALALVFQHGDDMAKSAAKILMPEIARTGTMLFEFCAMLELLGGWGRSKKNAVGGWYSTKSADNLAYQAVKYRQRNGWTHRDAMRLGHPQGLDPNVVNFILGKDLPSDDYPVIIHSFQAAQACTKIETLLDVLDAAPNLPWEAVPTSFHKNVELWKKLFYNGALNGQALLRNVTRLAKLKAFDDMQFAADFGRKLMDIEMIRKTRLHPIQYLLTIVNYTDGQVQRNATRGGYGYYSGRVKDWTVSPVINDALNAGFYSAFQAVEPANKKTMIGLDVSGSMSGLAGGIDLSCAQVGAAMAMSVARTEPYYQIHGFAGEFKDLGISPKMDLQSVMRKVQDRNFGTTDCALPMQYAKKNKIDVDTFVVMTDNETWAGHQQPFEALKEYRNFVGHDAKLVVMGMTATELSIADPSDPGMLDVVGADASVPKLVANFSAGR